MSSRRWFIETSPDVKQFVHLKRSRSYNHHGRHHHQDRHRCCRDDCCHAGRDEWNDLVTRERKLREVNECLIRDNNTLKCNFQEAEAEARRLAGILPLLQTENKALRDENAALRCSLENAGGSAGKYHREVERLRGRLHRLERERDGLIARIKELSRHYVSDRVGDLKRTIIIWQRRFEALDDHNKRLRRDIDSQRCVIQEQAGRIRLYERVLRRHGFRCE
ncbi:hypothetical protein CTRI78_v000651 [Colletotrichum trifolii]|uniref:Uncharacterized protein n=1 Tax=Colletotrichum trifolii TaxID=5466 RepID=A0A4R8RY68_COLTR|nr:hypothetical protein CTRI78_v000651 [Colletotrichum trifolii]